MASVVFPSDGYRVLSTLVHLLGCSVLSICLARRIEWDTVIKFCTMAIFIDSWLFVFSGGIMVSGVGMSKNDQACLSGVYLCISFYAVSKVLIYILLSEKVHIVWSAGIPTRRFQSRIWLLCAFVLLGYAVILVLMLIGRVGYLNPPDADGNRTCIIGLEPMASIPLLSYDIFLNVFLTSLFVYPLLSPNFWGLNKGFDADLSEGRKSINPKLRALAKRTCYAAAVALGTSVVNILILTLLHGRQLGWVCLASCGVDVTVNAIAIFLITRKNPADEPRIPKARPVFDKESFEIPSRGAYPHNVMTLLAKDVDGDRTPGSESPTHPPSAVGRGRIALSPKPYVAGSAKHRKTLSSPKHHQNVGGSSSTKRPSTGGHSGGHNDVVESRDATLSQIGDFAATRDDGEGAGPTASVGSVIGGAGAWASGFRGGRSNRTNMRNSGDKNGGGGGRGNTLQMVPVLVQREARGITSSVSLGDLQEEGTEPRTSDSVPKMYAFDDDDYDDDDDNSKRGKRSGLSA